jgi:hypothetical protein
VEEEPGAVGGGTEAQRAGEGLVRAEQ